MNKPKRTENAWELQIFIFKKDYEISVIKKDNKLGHDSWGWGGSDKIILFDNQYANIGNLDISDKDFMINIANKLCYSLNNE